MNLAQAIMDAAQLAERHAWRPNVFYMNPVDHAEMLDAFEYSDALTAIRRRGGTYHDVTTTLGRMHVARRLARRHQRRFHAMQWLRGDA